MDKERESLPTEEFVFNGLPLSEEYIVVKTMNCADLIKYYEENPKIDANFLYLQVDGIYVKPQWEDDYVYTNAILAESQVEKAVVNPEMRCYFLVFEPEFEKNKKKECGDTMLDGDVSSTYGVYARSYAIENVDGEITFVHSKNSKSDSNYNYKIDVYCGEELAMVFYYWITVAVPLEYFENLINDKVVKLTRN